MLSTIGRYFDPWEVHIIRARLVAEGVPASVAGDQHIMANWPLSVALGGATLQVPEAHQEEAREILAAYGEGVFEQDLVAEHPGATEVCPSCGDGNELGFVPLRQQALAMVTFLLASAPFPTRASRMQCRASGHRW